MELSPLRTRPRAALGGAAVALMIVVGCGEPRVTPVDAVFYLDGQPLADAAVTFVRSTDEKGRAAFGATDAQGRVSLTTYSPNDGAPPGNYRVVVIKPPRDEMTFEEVEVTDAASMVKSAAPAPTMRSRGPRRVWTLIPEVYGDPGTTPLTCTVVPGGEQQRFELSSNP